MALCCALLSTGAFAIELAAYPQVYSGPQGIEVVLAPAKDGKEALMRVSGINDPIDQVIFLGKLEQRGSSTQAYVTPLDGRDYGLVHKQANTYGGGERVVVYLPGQRAATALSFDEKKSKALKTAELETTYLRQQKEGLQARLARFDKDKRVAFANGELQRADQTASESCGSLVKTTVDWNSISDEQLKALSISGYCGEVASQLDTMCRSTPAFKTKAASLGQVSCSFGPELKLRADNGRVVFTTQQDAPNQGDFIQQFLRNQ